jgi:hypothetical protein
MNKTILLATIFILGLSMVANAQEPISFRSNALGGIVNDDLDLVYDPIELQFVDGIRLYTNLSNLTSNQEQLFHNISDDEFLFGVSSQNPLLKFLWHSALVRFQNSETSNSVGIDSDLDGYTDIYGNGTLIDEYTAYMDSDYDGLFDLKQMFSQEKSNFTIDDNYSFILNNSFKLRILAMGVKLSMGNATSTGNTAPTSLGTGNNVLSGVGSDDPTFSRSVTTHLFEDGYDNLIWSEAGNFNSENKFSFTNLDVSAMVNLWDFEMRADIALYSNQTLSNDDYGYSGQYKYFEPEITDYDDDYSETDSYISKTDEDGGGVVLGGSARYTFDEQDERKNDGFWKVGVSADFGSYDYIGSTSSQFLSTEAYFDGFNTNEDDFGKTNSEHSSTTDNGTKKTSSFAINGRLNIPLDENVHFGIGAFLNKSKKNRETNYTESLNAVLDYDYTDTDYNENDYLTTETSQLSADRNFEILRTIFACPAGLEYRTGKENKWSLRFGSIFTMTNQTINDAKQITGSEPHVTETEYGDGDIAIDFDDNIYESTSEHTRTTSSSTVFTYGLGYNPMENLQIDVLGFLGTNDNSIIDASFYRNLRLSFTMKF